MLAPSGTFRELAFLYACDPRFAGRHPDETRIIPFHATSGTTGHSCITGGGMSGDPPASAPAKPGGDLSQDRLDDMGIVGDTQLVRDGQQ
jgi:hypothetical protein